jgi:EmrB/QacA subfamily drug resistance transporter
MARETLSAGSRWTLAIVCGATAVLLLDVTIVNVALPAIRSDLHAGFDDLQWVIDAYALTLAVTVLSAGSLADRLGRRRVFMAGLAVFVSASLLCALAGTPLLLNLARGAQGVGAAAMFATSLAILADSFEGAERGRALGIWGAVSGGAAAAGPLVGGGLVDGLGWEWIFWLNLPVGAALWLAARTHLPESRDPRAAGIDWPGVVTSGAGLFLVLLGLIRGNADGWGSPTVVSALAGGAALLVLFVAVELRREAPMLDVRLFRHRAFAATAGVAFVQSVAIYPMFLFLAVYFQDELGLSPLDTGLRLLPVTCALLVFAPLSGALTSRVSLRTLLATGLALVGAGMLLMNGLEPGDDFVAMLAGLIVGGAGIGIISPALAAAMVGVLPAARSGLSSGINNAFRQTGIAAGIAGLGAIFQDRLAADGFVAGLNEIFVVAGVVALAGAAVTAVVLKPDDFEGSRLL